MRARLYGMDGPNASQSRTSDSRTNTRSLGARRNGSSQSPRFLDSSPQHSFWSQISQLRDCQAKSSMHWLVPQKEVSSYLPPASSSHIRIFKTLLAKASASFSVSPGATAAKTKMPLPMDDINCLSTVTEAERTLCRIAILQSA